MRTRSIVAVMALIAATALVAFAGPADSTAPGASSVVGQDDLRPSVLDAVTSRATTVSSTEPDVTSAGAIGVDAVLLEPAPTTPHAMRPAAPQPEVKAKAVVRHPWRTAEYSWYGRAFYGSGTACGQTYTKSILGVAHRTLPCGTKVTLRNPSNGRSITVRVIDRGPWVDGRLWDLSRATCTYLRNCHTATIEWRLP